MSMWEIEKNSRLDFILRYKNREKELFYSILILKLDKFQYFCINAGRNGFFCRINNKKANFLIETGFNYVFFRGLDDFIRQKLSYPYFHRLIKVPIHLQPHFRQLRLFEHLP